MIEKVGAKVASGRKDGLKKKETKREETEKKEMGMKHRH